MGKTQAGRDLASGGYGCRGQAGEMIRTQRMVLLR